MDQTVTNGIATLALDCGKVNALRLEAVEALDAALSVCAHDDAVSTVILTGRGAFFSFGFDVPHFLGRSRDEFGAFLHAFTDLYTRLFLFPKPIVAAINGHAVAGGWMLAQACDARVAVAGRTRLGLNEVRFGAALFAGSMAILRHLAGGAGADFIAGTGAFVGPEEAAARGLVDEVCGRDELEDRSTALAEERYGTVTQPSFADIRKLVRGPVVDAYRERETPSIERFMDVWFSPQVQSSLEGIVIRE